jgi:hypothetical protein
MHQHDVSATRNKTSVHSTPPHERPIPGDTILLVIFAAPYSTALEPAKRSL